MKSLPRACATYRKNMPVLEADRELLTLGRVFLKQLGVTSCAPEMMIRSQFYQGYDIDSLDYAKNFTRQSLEGAVYVFLPWLRRELENESQREAINPSAFAKRYLKILSRHHRVQTCGWNRAAAQPLRRKATYGGYANGWTTADGYVIPTRPGRLRERVIRVVRSFEWERDGGFRMLPRPELVNVIAASDLPLHMEKLAGLFSDLMGSLDAGQDEFQNKARLYIHAFYWAHPFDAVNKSILFTQINAVLLLRGEAPIQPGFFDVLAYENPTEIDPLKMQMAMKSLRLKRRK